MESPHFTSEEIPNDTLYSFYTYAVLPQFGIRNKDIEWIKSEPLDGDEFLHRFQCENESYTLVFEDYEGMGRNEEFILQRVIKENETFSFIYPISQTACAPSYDGFRLPAPAQYRQNITGTYTLIKVHSR